MTALTDRQAAWEAVTDPATIPGGLLEYKVRELPSGLLEFEYAPVGFLTKKGEPRLQDWRAYFWTPADGRRERMVSVTTLLDSIVPKGGLPFWAEARGIEGAVVAVRLGEITADTDPLDGIQIVRSLKLGADRARDTAAMRGVNIHALLEAYMRTGEPPSLADHPVEHHGYIQSLCSWLLKRNPEPEAIEELVCDPAAGYAGRSDLVARCSGVRVRYDAKTQERGQIYAGAHLQVKLYERAAVVCGDEPSDELRVVVFPADGGEAREMACEATGRTVERALAFYEDVRPIDSVCESWNRKARKERV